MTQSQTNNIDWFQETTGAQYPEQVQALFLFLANKLTIQVAVPIHNGDGLFILVTMKIPTYLCNKTYYAPTD